MLEVHPGGGKLSADRDMIPGSRIWPSLRALSQIGGHGDGSPRFMEPRDFGGVYFSTNGYVPPYGEDKMPCFSEKFAKILAGSDEIIGQVT